MRLLQESRGGQTGTYVYEPGMCAIWNSSAIQGRLRPRLHLDRVGDTLP